MNQCERRSRTYICIIMYPSHTLSPVSVCLPIRYQSSSSYLQRRWLPSRCILVLLRVFPQKESRSIYHCHGGVLVRGPAVHYTDGVGDHRTPRGLGPRSPGGHHIEELEGVCDGVLVPMPFSCLHALLPTRESRLFVCCKC